jgi:murein DD-endopeptidase MepM/ murein hydrolase activator NlpD
MSSRLTKFGLLLVLALLFASLAQAQDPTTTPEETSGGLLIHVVQRNETLFQIAQQYGTTLEALTTVNSLLDPDQLQVGQRLMIPTGNAAASGVVTVHVVAPGETLFTLAQRYNSTPQSLAEVNSISNGALLYAGQEILVTQGATGEIPLETASLHTVQAGDSLLKLSLRYQMPMLDIARANNLDLHMPLQVGARLIIPGLETGERFVRLPAPIVDFQLGPLPAEQGHTLGALLKADQDVTVSGNFLEREIIFYPNDDTYYAMIGIHSLLDPGVYPLRISLTEASGEVTTYETRIRVSDGGYSSENIDLPADRQELLDINITGPEQSQIEGLMSGHTLDKYFTGLMNLPSIGPVTSRYGTRRTYSGSDYTTFHAGSDFGGAPGSLVSAPASGMVVFAGPLQVRGNAIIIDHGWGVYSGFWHGNEMFVSAGQFVQKGEIISTLGNTGLSTGAHLHWEMWVGGVQVDPLQWLTYQFDPIVIPSDAAAVSP